MGPVPLLAGSAKSLEEISFLVLHFTLMEKSQKVFSWNHQSNTCNLYNLAKSSSPADYYSEVTDPHVLQIELPTSYRLHNRDNAYNNTSGYV